MALDFACQVYPGLLDVMTGVIINGKACPVNTILQDQDTVEIDTKGNTNHEDWENAVRTYSGKMKIKSLTDGQNPDQAL